MTGRKTIPTELKILRLSAKEATKLVRRQIPVAGGLVEPPAGFTADQIAEWNYAIENAPREVLKKIDRGILAGYVIAADLHRQAIDAVNRGGMVLATSNGNPIQNPFLSIVNRQALLMIRAADQLGFTPCSRARIESGTPPATSADGWEEVAAG